MKKTILVDMDGVLADVYTRFFEIYEKETGCRLKINDIAGRLEEEAFGDQRKWVETPGFFRDLPVISGSQNALRKINEYHNVIIVSLATEFPASLTDKQLWLQDHFPFIGWKQTVFCGDKNIIKADLMIDDHPKNLDNFNGETIMFTQPHNIFISSSRHRRVNSWAEIEQILIP